MATSTKSTQTRQRLLDAAATVFRDKGYAGALLGDIAREAGMHTPGIYYYFDSKEDLALEVLRLGVERTYTYVRQRVAALPPGAPALDRLRAAIEGHLVAVLEIGPYTTANIRMFGMIPDELRTAHLADHRAYGAFWRQLLEDASAAGELRPDVNLSVARMLILGALNWAPEWYRPGAAQSAEEVAAEATRMICDGLGLR